MEIRVITPVIDVIADTLGPLTLAELSAAASPDTAVTNVYLETGPVSIESEYDAVLAGPGILASVRRAADEGVGAVVILCMTDPALNAARELVTIPVIGLCETSMHLATMLGHRFSVVTILDRLIPQFEDLATTYGTRGQLASVRSIDMTVLEMEESREQLSQLLIDQASKAVQEDDAHVIMLGCGGMMGLAREMREELKKLGCSVPVIDPAIVALKAAEALAAMGLSHSKKSYPRPAEKETVGY